MIDRLAGCIVICCDSCSEQFTIDSPDFASTWNDAKHEGWRVRKIGTVWNHSCPSCEDSHV